MDRTADLCAYQPVDALCTRRPRHAECERAGAAATGCHRITGGDCGDGLRGLARARLSGTPDREGAFGARLSCTGDAVPRGRDRIWRIQDAVDGDWRARPADRLCECCRPADGAFYRAPARDRGASRHRCGTGPRHAGDADRKFPARADGGSDWRGHGVCRELGADAVGDGAVAERHGTQRAHRAVRRAVRAPDYAHLRCATRAQGDTRPPGGRCATER